MNKPDIMMTLVLGDWSGDGHGQMDKINILSNLDKKEVLKSYKKGSKILGFNFIDDVCADYEDTFLPKKHLESLIEQGFKFANLSSYDKKNLKECLEEDCDGNGFSIWIDHYTDIFLFVVKLGNKDFEYEVLKEELCPTINIGGYGLFGS